MAIIRDGNPTGIVIHHSAVSPGAENLTTLKQRATSYNKTHSTRSWAETTKASGTYPYIAYHDMMDKEGNILHTVDYKYVKYHASNYNANHHYIGICLDGNYQTEKPTAKQKEALARYISQREKDWGVNIYVRGHKEVADASAATSCPGTNIGVHNKGWLKEVIDRANYITENGIEEECPDCKEKDNQIAVLNSKVSELQTSIKSRDQKIVDLKNELETLEVAHGKELIAWEDKYNLLKKDMMRINTDKGKIQLELDQLKQNRFWWVAQWLDKIVPKKSE